MLFRSFHESAVTIIDHSIQELLLAGLLREGFTDLAFNGEEDTHLKFFFSNNYTRNLTLHCDPIDGTDSFRNGENRYCTGYGLSRFEKKHHEFFSSIIYAPLTNTQYWAFEDSVSKHRRLSIPKKTICVKRCFNAGGKEQVKGLGYEFVNPGSAHLAITDVTLGHLGAFLWWDTNPHDALVPFAFAKNYGIYPTDEHGNKFKKFDLKVKEGVFERIPKICWFANDEIKDEIIPLLSEKKYLV